MEELYKDTVTIWNRMKASGVWEEDTWYPTVITNARLIVSQGNNVLKSGVEGADTARLHISDAISVPDKPYADPVSWKDAPDVAFTLESQDGSFFTRGDTSGEAGTDGFFEYMEAHHADCYRISKVDRFEVIPHFEVFGK